MKLETFTARLGVPVVLLVASAHAQAVPLGYSEASSGDLSFPAPAFTLDTGDNTISGTTHFSVNSPGLPRFDTDFDSFAFDIPIGLRLVGISLSFLTSTFNVTKSDLELRLCSGISACGLDPIEFLGAQTVDLLGSSPQTVDFALPSAPSSGTFSIFTSGLGMGVADASIAQANWSANYTWTLAVQAVSEPSALALLALGCSGLVWALRIRKQ